MRLFLFSSLLLSSFLCVIGSSVPCTANDQTPAAVRTANREQALATLDSPDPIARLSAMEDVLSGQDSTLKRLAARKVFSGTDTDLRTLALLYFLSQSDRQYIFVIDQCRELQSRDSCKYDAPRFKGVVPLIFSSMNTDSGEFQVHSHYSEKKDGRFVTKPGRITHGEAIFEINAREIHNGCFYNVTFHMRNIKDNRYIGTLTCGTEFQLTGGFDLF